MTFDTMVFAKFAEKMSQHRQAAPDGAIDPPPAGRTNLKWRESANWENGRHASQSASLCHSAVVRAIAPGAIARCCLE
jgi:hypothetical protein